MATAYVYILTNDRGNVLYIGSTEDLQRRMYFHKGRLIAGFTKEYNVHRLVYFETIRGRRSSGEATEGQDEGEEERSCRIEEPFVVRSFLSNRLNSPPLIGIFIANHAGLWRRQWH
jgi:hypothetical protein